MASYFSNAARAAARRRLARGRDRMRHREAAALHRFQPHTQSIIATKTGTFWSGYFWKTLVRETVHESIGGTSQPRHGMRADG
jgi:hypothetical protein